MEFLNLLHFEKKRDLVDSFHMRLFLVPDLILRPIMQEIHPAYTH